jgi:hypothetical protein
MLGTHGQLQMPCSGSASEPITEPDTVAVTLTPASWSRSRAPAMTPASRPVRRASCTAHQADPRIVSVPVTRMPELTTNDPLPRLIVEGTVNSPAVPH